ncbi:PREDICTED: uncharacterized protein LOC109585566 [Amphimedon queenslandica]|uniref:Death domain-containing protein n=1 Tax=Amphimedon queenslandica TaxID=400682 RepID=A0A1X7TXT3_AMPQE|nr:PREDICTED: uncharacterized protein LOC109585566 [Amphimedon queenslandica]|eukprot:XP_019857243.1 PREDICTED: uncharacterized protein LOC109585566 [Amphimedon queenslandica]
MAAELSITDLGDVISTLEKYEFAEHRWVELGLKLHISQPKLDAVGADNPLNAKARLRACLAHWLRWNYEVDKYGKPSMEKLAAAIKEMGLKHVASKILGETNGTTQGASTGSGGGGVAVTVTAETVERVKKELDKVLRENQVKIHGIFTETDETLNEIARQLNAVNIIGKPVQKNPTYEAMIGSFLSGINLKEDIEDIEEHSGKFFKALSNVEGPVSDAGNLIKKKWKKAVKDNCGLELNI